MGEIFTLTHNSQKSGSQDCFKSHVPQNCMRCRFWHSLHSLQFLLRS